MRTIWKKNLEFTHKKQELHMPVGAQVLTVKEQRGKPCLWYTADSVAEHVTRTFIMVGTGHQMPYGPDRDITYVGTVFFDDDYLVFHVFEIGSPS